MVINFKSCNIEPRSVKINGKIKNAIKKYRDFKIPSRVLLTDYLAVKSKGDALAEAENPWAYNYKGIEGHEVESGVSLDETAFRFAAMEIKDQNPTDVINAAFFSNKNRNDSEFEMGYVLPIVLQNLNPKVDLLFVNPSPDIISEIEGLNHPGNRFYAVTDSTVASLYKIQFPDAYFIPFEDMNRISKIDLAVIFNRDQKMNQLHVLLNCLNCCDKKESVVFGLVPCAWFDNTATEAYRILDETGFYMSNLLIVDPKVTTSTPRKKMFLVLNKQNQKKTIIKHSSYDTKSRFFSVSSESIQINPDEYLRKNKTILSCWKEAQLSGQETNTPKYRKADPFAFSKEISIFCKVYSDRKNKFAGIAYYKEIRSIDPLTWGRKISSDIEKGLRADSREAVYGALEETAFDDKLYPIIRDDIEKNYIISPKTLTLKTIWFYCWNYLSGLKKYDHEYVRFMFDGHSLADYTIQFQTESVLLAAIADSLNVNVEEIPYKGIEQINMVLDAAVRQGLSLYNPLESYVADYSRRATERQQDVRNALVKKHFSPEEEKALFQRIIGRRKSRAKRYYFCSEKSLFLATAIRLFTGMAIREVAALNWEDYKRIRNMDAHQFLITKFVNAKGEIVLHSEKENWKRLRVVPVSRTLAKLLDERKQYLLELGIEETYLQQCPIVLQEEKIADMRKKRKIRHCKPLKISALGNELVRGVIRSENEVVLPDEKSDLVTDFNRYHGDIFLSNFRHKANHNALFTMGEINYMIGIEAPDTLSRHYCDYANDFLQADMIQKLSRWDLDYERMISSNSLSKPSFKQNLGNVSGKIGPYRHGVAEMDMVIENRSEEDAEVIIEVVHGMDVNITKY